MRLKLGRPTSARTPTASTSRLRAGALGVTFLGVSSLLIDDGELGGDDRRLLLAAALRKLALGKIAPGPRRGSTPPSPGPGVDRLEAVLPVHTHFDHAMDSAVVAERTGALLVGGESTANVGRGHGLPEDRIRW